MPTCGSSKFTLPLHTLGASTPLRASLSVASDLDPRGTGSCDINFRTRNPRVSQREQQHHVRGRPSFKFCIPSAWPLPSLVFFSGGGEERALGDLSLLAVTVVCEAQRRHWLSLRPPVLNHMGLFGDHCVLLTGIRWGARSFPCLCESFCSRCWNL